jgi:PAS domain S-box-containing protein
MTLKIKDESINQPVWIGFGIAFVILLAIAGMALNNTIQSNNSVKLIDHTHQIMNELNKLQSNMERVENRQWAYFLTKEKNYIPQRDKALEQIKKSFTLLLELTKVNEVQQKRLRQLHSVFDNRSSILFESQKKFDAEGFSEVTPLFYKGQEVANVLSNFIAEAEREEQTFLSIRKDKEASRVKMISGIIIFLSIFLLLLAVWLRKTTRYRLAIKQAWFDQYAPLLQKGALQDAIFNSANFSSIATDAKGVIQIFNVGAERMLGYTAAEVMNKITPAEISDSQEVIERAANLSVELETPIKPGFEALAYKASRGIEDIYELTYIRKDGSRFPALVSVTALRDEVTNIIGYLLIGTDNTVRKQVEAERELIDQRLRDLQFYTRSLIESNIDALTTTDTLGIIRDVNHEMELLTGCSKEELIGKPFKTYFTDPAQAEAGIKRVLMDGKVTNYELTVKTKDGNETVVSYNATTFHDSSDNLMGVLAAARDITHRKSFEKLMEKNNIELIAATEQADKANMAKSEFLSSMSHELRTPLNAVLGFAQLMASDVPPPTASQQMSIDQILQAGWYLLRLINEILDLTMIESGKVNLSMEPISFTEVLQDCESMIEPQAQKYGINLIFPELDNSFYVHADHVRVKQVIINLLSNAIKYNRDGGTVTVDCIMTGENQVRVSVADTGNGLNPNQLEQLFQPFNRLGQESSSKEGTGIGLVVTKQLIELMGGSIGVESQVGIGSVFWVELAASNVPSLSLENDIETSLIVDVNAEPVIAINKRTILYVEDNPANLTLVEQLIARRKDLVLLSAVDGHIGIQMARSYQPDVILMDINLPGINGYAALKVLRKDPATLHIPVLALSANAMQRDIDKGLAAGFLRYLTKPINVVDFMEALDMALIYSEESQ